MSGTIKIGIIGPRAFRADSDLLIAKQKCIDYITSLKIPIPDITLQSGGCSGVDHLAVLLFLEGINGQEFKSLHLYLPASFSVEKQCFVAKNMYQKKAADTLNQLHTKSSLKELATVLPLAQITIGNGFFSRNRKLAESCTHLLALTYAPGNVPDDGGTRYTWNHARHPRHTKRTHISLSSHA